MIVDKLRINREKSRVKDRARDQNEPESFICLFVDGKHDTKALSY